MASRFFSQDVGRLRALVVHSPGAGEGHPNEAELVEAMRRAGYETRYRNITEAKWRSEVREDVDFVVVAGGDGSVKSVAIELAGSGIPIAPVPTGTANNISLFLGVAGSLEEIVDGISRSRPREVDVGVAIGPWGRKRFLEAVGFGAFARTIRDADEARNEEDEPMLDRDQRLTDDLTLLRAYLGVVQPVPCRVTLDDDPLAGDYILAAIMNTTMVGPNLVLAPAADPTDGWFDVTLVEESARPELAKHLKDRIRGLTGPAPGEILRRAKRVTLRWEGNDVHIDDFVWPKKREEWHDVSAIEVTVEASGDKTILLEPVSAEKPERAAVTKTE